MRIRVLSVLLVVGVLLALFPAAASAGSATYYCLFNGDVTIGGVLANTGTAVSAWIEGVLCGETVTGPTTGLPGQLPYKYTLLVYGDPGQFEGKVVQFLVDGVEAEEDGPNVWYMYGAQFVDLSVAVAPTLMEGDANLDDHVSGVDALLIARFVVGLGTLSADQQKCADTTDEGNVTGMDALHIAQWVVDPTGTAGVLTKDLWEAPADNDMLPPVPL